ncbi:ABC transporter permease, partial [Achromobacter ruhlandii]
MTARESLAAGARQPASVAAPSPPRARRDGAAARAVLGLGGLAALLGLWWLGTEVLAPAGGMARRFAPGATFASLWQLLTGSDLPLHVLVSLRRVAVGLGLALAIGVPLGLAIGSYRRLEAALSPAMQFLRMISPLSWMPIAVMVFGVGDDPVYFLL